MNHLSLEAIRLNGMRLLVAFLWCLGIVASVSAAFVGGDKLWVSGLALLLPVYPTILVLRRQIDEVARVLVSATVPAAPALLLYIFEGNAWQVDLHMIFFAALAMISVLCDRKALLAATGFVAVHHLGLGMLLPSWVFLGEGSLGRILLHAVILVAEAATLCWIAGKIIDLLQQVETQAGERAALEAQAQAEKDRQAEALLRTVDMLGEGLAALSGGDLTARISDEFPEGYAALRTGFNETAERLGGLVGALSTGALGIRSSTEQIAQTSQNLSHHTEANAASLEETAASIDHLNDRLRAVAEAAESTLEQANDADAAVCEGRGITADAVAAMSRVREGAVGIDAVIEGVDKIAFQTRVLAMNAAVEAGRAGEAGRGFAVVADLVSALALRAEEEARKAREELTATQLDIGHAVEAVGRVDAALAGISTSFGSVHGLLDSMAQDNRHQAATIAQISTAVSAMNHATQENSAMVEEASSATTSLMSEVVRLSDLAAEFRVDDVVAKKGRAVRPARRGAHAGVPGATLAAV